MKLIYKILLRSSAGMLVIMLGWAVLFYFGMTRAVDDEIDGMLSDYSEQLIIRFLSGDSIMAASDGMSGQYELVPVSEEFAEEAGAVRFSDEDIYIYRIDDDVQSRVMRTVFPDGSGRYYQLTVATPSYEKDDISQSLLLWTSVLYVCLLASSVFIYVTVFHRSMRPFYQLVSWLDNYKIGSKNPPLCNPTDVKEFAHLNNVAVRAMERNESVYEQQRQFTGNASHELQTPLAICMNRVEMLMEDETLSPEQLKALASVMDSLSGMQKLNKSMLLLSKIDAGQFPASGKVSFSGIVDKLLGDFKVIYGHKEMEAGCSECADFECCINEQLAIILVANLLKNAFVHGKPGGRISIDIASDCFAVANSADSGELDSSAIFQRFNQCGRSKSKGSSGLGLAIVASICSQSGLSVDYSFTDGCHRFEIRKKRSI